MEKKLVLTGSILILISIILGAMAAHALEKIISPALIETFEKGVKYQIYTGFGLLIVGLGAHHFSFRITSFYWLNLIGVLLFSGCIYLYTFHEQMPALKPAVYIVPLGGSTMIIAWAILVIQLIRNN
jgi:uncharacterized membrane protein YgdD (TMEM256/DUF423 family)